MLIRLSEEEKGGFERAAEVAGLSLSSWVRLRLRAATTKELAAVGEKFLFLKPKDTKGSK